MEEKTDAFNVMKGLLDKGMERSKGTDSDKKDSRLEWILEKNPDVDAEKLKVMPEIHDIAYVMGEVIRRMSFRIGIESVGVGLAITAICYGCIKMSPNNEFLILNSALAVPLSIYSAEFIYNGCKHLTNNIKTYFMIKKAKCEKPLTPRERNLAEYI